MRRFNFSILMLIIAVFIISFSNIAKAKALKGFHEGPYLRLIGGVISSKFDNNARTGEKVANNYEGAFGAHFGWNLWDSTAPELEMLYATKKVCNNREHIVNVNLNIKYSFVTNALTNIGSLHILPFVKGGPASLIAAVPGDRVSNNKLMTVWGLGFGGGAGVDFLIKQYIYFGFLIQGNVYYIPSVSQNINGTKFKIIAGGWEPQLSVIGAAGVHF